MPPVIDVSRCSGCGICEDSCPIDVLAMDEERHIAYARYADECWHCGSCRQECPVGCIDIKFPLRILFGAGVIPY